MSIKEKIKNLIPSYRVANNLTAHFDESIQLLNQKFEYLFWTSQHLLNESSVETKERVFRNMPPAAGRNRKCQLICNFLLQTAKKICDQNNLEMFLVGGTLLGAVRHHGFIPWDDDIDIGMTRKDFEQFREIVRDHPLIKIDTCYGNKYHNIKIEKIKLIDCDIFYIDIFLFDFFSDDGKTIDEKWEETQKLSSEYANKLGQVFDSLNFSTSKTNRPLPSHAIDSAMHSINNCYHKYHSDEPHGVYFGESIEMNPAFRAPIQLYRKHDVFPLIKGGVEFEGKTYDVFRNYRQCLERQYGDYWQLPADLSFRHSKEFESLSDEMIDIIFQRLNLGGKE